MAAVENDNKTKIRYNLQNWLKDNIEEFDYKRIASALNIKTSEVKKQIKEHVRTVDEQASILDSEKEYSAKLSRCEKQRILFVGDSNTSDRESYMKVARAILISAGHELIDSSVSGWRTTEFIDDIAFYILDYEVDIVHIMLGTNEVRRIDLSNGKSVSSENEFESNINFLIEVFKNRGVQIIVSTLPPYNLKKDTYTIRKWTIERSTFDRFNEIIAKSAKRNRCVLNDMRKVYKKYEVEDVLEDDGIHLSKKGHYVLAEQVIEKLIGLV